MYIHFGHTLLDVTVIQLSYNVDLLLTNANLGRIMKIMKIDIGAIVGSEYSNIRYLHLIISLIIGIVQNFVWNHKNGFQV